MFWVIVRAALMQRTGFTPEFCFPWEGHVGKDGYGQVSIGGIVYRTHRLAFEIYRRPIPYGKKLANTCGMKHCTNSHHWRVA